MNSTADTHDDRLIQAHGLARAALGEVTPPETVGDAAGYTREDDGVVSLRFANRLAGYPGWFWTVSVAVVADAEPTVLELELLPGEGALLAPDWVPWAERLAEYEAAQAATADAEADAGDGSDVDDDEEELSDDELDDDGGLDEDDDDLEDDDLDDDDSLDESDEDDPEPAPRLHAGDLDGVDIDELDETSVADDESIGEDDLDDGPVEPADEVTED